MEHFFEIQFLDHVAIRVKDIDISQRWYQEVLGLDKQTFPEWGDYPVFMVKGNFGVALFPANVSDPPMPNSKHVKIDHFAFRVSPLGFQKAKVFFEGKEIAFDYQDHHYFESFYLRDPDGHVVELTTKTSKVIKQD